MEMRNETPPVANSVDGRLPAARKPYRTPEITNYGSLYDLTKAGGNVPPDDGLGGSANNV